MSPKLNRDAVQRIARATLAVEKAPFGDNQQRPSIQKPLRTPWHKYDLFGHPISSTHFRVYAGQIQLIGQNLDMAQQDVEVPGAVTGDHGPYYIYVQHVFGTSNAKIVEVAVDTEPVTELGVFRKWLFEVRKSEGTIYVSRYGHFNISITPVYATGQG